MSSPPVALLAWELGEGLGHARRLLAISRALREAGFTCVIAQRELWACADEFRAAGVSLVQAPAHRGDVPPGQVFRARGYADVMAVCGFARIDHLWPTILGWDGLIDAVSPDVIVADYSPLLALAAYGRVPLVSVGDGFVLPPTHGATFPVLREGTRMAGEADMLANAVAIQTRRGLPAPESLPALIRGAASIVSTYPECDVYAEARETPALGPIEGQPPRSSPPITPSLFVYLAADFAHTAKLLQLVLDLRHPTTTYVRHAPEALKSALRTGGVQVYDTPPPLADVLPTASLVVHHGGIGTIETCLAAGRPQLVLPRHFEQALNAATLSRLGVGARLPVPFSLADGRTALEEALASDGLRERAVMIAEALTARKNTSLDGIVAACCTLSKRR